MPRVEATAPSSSSSSSPSSASTRLSKWLLLSLFCSYAASGLPASQAAGAALPPLTCNPGPNARPRLGFRVMWDIDLPILLNSSAASANRNVTTLAAQRKVATGTPCECATLCGDPTVRCDFWAWTAAEPPYALGNDDPADNQDGIGVNTTPNSASDSAGQATTAAWPATCFLRTLPHDGRDGITLVFRSSPDYPFLSPLPTRPEQLLPAPPPNPSTNVTTTSPSAACASMCATTDLCAYSIHESHSGVCLLYRGVARAGWAVGVWDDRVPALQPPPPPPPPMVVVAGGDGGEDQPPVVMVWLIVAVAVGTVVVVVAAAWRLHVWRRSKAETRMAAYGA